MKNYGFTLLTCLIANFCISQFTGENGRYLKSSNREDRGNREVIWSDDFSAGFSTGWSSSESGGIAAWEYRGPFTVPGVETGSRGSCTVEGSAGAIINSTTWSNGFVIFDSNWWDNPDLPCTSENFGSGTAPGPHEAYLTSPSIDLTAYPNVALHFHHYLNLYQGEVRVEARAGLGNWQSIYLFNQSPFATANTAEVFFPLGNLGGQPDVQIRFVFQGFYYFWQLDDVEIVETLDNDLAIRGSTYGDFDFNDLSHPTGFEFMEYSIYPQAMPPLLKFSTQCDNVGADTQTDCRLHVELKDPTSNTVLYDAQSAEGFVIPSGGSTELRAGSYLMSASPSAYQVAYNTISANADEAPANNIDTLNFSISNATYARDRLSTNALYFASPQYAGNAYEIGNIFLITEDDLACSAIQVAVGVGTVTPCTMYAALYAFDAGGTLLTTQVGQTTTVNVTDDMLNNFGSSNFVELTFDIPVNLVSGISYFAAVGSANGPENFICAMSGESPALTSWAKFYAQDNSLPDDWVFLDRIPMVRMQLTPYVNVDSKSVIQNLHAYPNPANSILTVDVSHWIRSGFTCEIVDATGRVVVPKVNSNELAGTLSVEVADLSVGLYELIINSNSQCGRIKFIKE